MVLLLLLRHTVHWAVKVDPHRGTNSLIGKAAFCIVKHVLVDEDIGRGYWSNWCLFWMILDVRNSMAHDVNKSREVNNSRPRQPMSIDFWKTELCLYSCFASAPQIISSVTLNSIYCWTALASAWLIQFASRLMDLACGIFRTSISTYSAPDVSSK